MKLSELKKQVTDLLIEYGDGDILHFGEWEANVKDIKLAEGWTPGPVFEIETEDWHEATRETSEETKERKLKAKEKWDNVAEVDRVFPLPKDERMYGTCIHEIYPWTSCTICNGPKPFKLIY